MRVGKNMMTNEFEIYLDEDEREELRAALKCSGLEHTRKLHKLIEAL